MAQDTRSDRSLRCSRTAPRAPGRAWQDHRVAGDEQGQALLESIAVPWQAALQEGWAAFCVGNPRVGAVNTSPDGAVVAAGRNRRHDRDGPAGQLAGTSLAHAELNAFAQLPPGRYRDYTLWATLQPCPLCSAAAMSAGCGQVRFLAADPMWDGADRLPELNRAVAARWPRFRGPEPGWPASWQTVLSVAYQASQGNATSPAVTERAKVAPHAAQLGLGLADDPAALTRLTACPLATALSQIHLPVTTRS
jgi:tRNA(Arg) A34 adenosine deaminase TadA